MRFQIRHLLLSWAVSCTCSIALAPPAQAQSFFQKLFGTSTQPAVAVPPSALPGRTIAAHRFRYRSQHRYQSHPQEQPAEDEIGAPDSAGPYRTLCVRACDGFYFPIRHDAYRRNFASDIKFCRSACGDEARLFYFREAEGSVETMTDLAGRPYSDMPQAFAYRKALVSGCSCKPAPWTKEEAARHRSYAEAEAQRPQQAEPQIAAPPNKDSANPPPAIATANVDTPQPKYDAVTAEAAAEQLAASPDEPSRIERPLRRKAKSRIARVRYVPTSGIYRPQPKNAFMWLIE